MSPAAKSKSAETAESAIPIAEQTTIKVRRDYSDALKVICAWEQRTMLSVVDELLGDYIEKYEQMSGQRVRPPRKPR